MKKTILLFSVLLFAFSYEQQRPVHIFMIGDSTMANKSPEAKPETGWGEVLQLFFSDDVKVSNHARNGRSSKSFIGEGLWQQVVDSLMPGDYVIIQFGHNDQKPDTARHTDPFTSYKANLERYINEARAKGATPVLCTSIIRRKFNEEGKLIDTHGEYPAAVRLVAEEMNVPLLDLQKRTHSLVEELGDEESKTLFMHLGEGEYPNRPKSLKDDTHLRPEGAKVVAAMAVEEMKAANLPVFGFVKE
ncbi:MAG: rhamnogalacturonan acetylesterase [Bacteroidales bacterium]|nr:rhamnogalacturonan acetylesterase [Bacteroidales bacterium]